MNRQRMRAALAMFLACCVSASAGGAGHDMDAHMSMTAHRATRPGDQARADAVLAAARKAAEHYKDYKVALADGYEIFMPDQKQGVYHFVNEIQAVAPFDPGKPPALLYEKTMDASEYKLIGVMYMARFNATEDEMDQRIPLSVSQWHVHTKMCIPADVRRQWLMGDAKFGLDGSITTAEACRAAGGHFMPHLSGWMVHVYPFEKDPARIWAAGMDDDHLMGSMPGMKM